MSNPKSKIQQQNDARAAEKAARHQQIMEADYSAATTLDELWQDLSTDEIKALSRENATFRMRQSELDNEPLPQTQTLAASPGEAAAMVDSERVAAEEAQAVTDRARAEETQGSGTPAATEKLYEGVEKRGENDYVLTLDPEDGSNCEIFYGKSQAECWKKLRESKKNATRELRRRAKKIQITQELENAQIERIPYPPLLEKVTLSPTELFDYTEQLKDPVTSLTAMQKLRTASMTQAEIDLFNENIIRQREIDAQNVASQWITTHPEFYRCPENIAALQDLMFRLDWGISIHNLNVAFKALKDQGIHVEKPEGGDQAVVTETPTLVVPEPAPKPAAAQPRPAAPARVYRPASNSTSPMATRRIDTIRTAPKVTALTPAEYHATPSAVLQARYRKDPAYRAQVDELIASGKV
jgi:hypothetical protein